MSHICSKECGKGILKQDLYVKRCFVLNVLTHVEKSFGAGTKPCLVLLALALVCNFYLLRMFIIWSYKAQAFKVHKLLYFLFQQGLFL